MVGQMSSQKQKVSHETSYRILVLQARVVSKQTIMEITCGPGILKYAENCLLSKVPLRLHAVFQTSTIFTL